MSDRGTILNVVEDLVSDFLYYGRKECEYLPLGEIENAIDRGEITVDEIVSHFEKILRVAVPPAALAHNPKEEP